MVLVFMVSPISIDVRSLASGRWPQIFAVVESGVGDNSVERSRFPGEDVRSGEWISFGEVHADS